MIQLVKKIGYPAPAILTNSGTAATALLSKRFTDGERDFGGKDFDSAIYGHVEVKIKLAELQDNKCCFCESKIGHISYGDVEHFRPKAGWVQDDEKINAPGYYWLAYDWDNLFLSCQKCNQRYKKNLFPLFNPGQRALSHQNDISLEQPIFVHPTNDNPEHFIGFKDEIPFAVNGNNRGAVTINKLGLDRELLNEQRRKTLNLVRMIYDLAKAFPDTPPELKSDAKDKIVKIHESSLLDETEYASMLRCFFRDNPIDF